jgi:endonuclease/exonuclease/phosphatase family metal-dependent hydrolase
MGSLKPVCGLIRTQFVRAKAAGKYFSCSKFFLQRFLPKKIAAAAAVISVDTLLRPRCPYSTLRRRAESSWVARRYHFSAGVSNVLRDGEQLDLTGTASVAAQTVSLRVLTVNAHKGFTFFNRKFILHELRDAVRAAAADVVFLQEVLGAHAGHSRRHQNWPAVPQYEFLADSMWTQYAYGRNAVYPDGDHGNALLSKYPILRYENRDVSIAGPERRGMLHCVLQIPDTEIELHAICVHLGLRAHHRALQLELLCQLIDTLPASAPLVVAGDFNDWRLHAHEVLDRRAGLREAFVAIHGRAAKTFPARYPLLALDRIYVRNAEISQPLVLANRPWSHLSDHVPLAAEISL